MNIIKLAKKYLIFQSDQKLKLPLISNCNDSLPINLTSSQFFTLFPISQILTLHLIAMILLLSYPFLCGFSNLNVLNPNPIL